MKATLDRAPLPSFRAPLLRRPDFALVLRPSRPRRLALSPCARLRLTSTPGVQLRFPKKGQILP